MRKLVRLLAAIGLLILLASPAFAQGQLYFKDDAGKLDRATIAEAAQPLMQRGALVAIYTANNGDATTFKNDLIADDLLRNNGEMRDGTIAIFIGFGKSYSAIRYGDSWAKALGTNNRYETIRTNDLNRGLKAGDFTQAVVDTLESINSAVGSTSASSGSTSSTSGSIGTVGTTSSSSGGGAWGWLLGGGVLVGGGALAYNAMKKSQGKQKVVASAREKYEDNRKQAGAAIADTLPLFQDAKEKAQYDRISYLPDDVTFITGLQQEAESAYRAAQEHYAAAEERVRGKEPSALTPEIYEELATAYAAAASEIETARAQLDKANARRDELDKINAAVPQAIAKAKQATQSVVDQAASLGDFDKPQAVVREATEQIARAEQLFAEHHSADAAQAAQQAEATAKALGELLGRFAALREQISTGRADAQQVAQQGYKTQAGLDAFSEAESELVSAALALQSKGAQAAAELLAHVDSFIAEGVGRGGGMPALKRENETRLAQVEQAGGQLPAQIERGRVAFDEVDEYAESTWSDIRGNGSEAQAAAARAKALWERAKTRNAGEEQDFYGAKLDLDAAVQEIDRARTLVDTITQRLSDLKAAQAAARKEIDLAQVDIAKGWQYIRENDADVGKAPEQALHQAEQLLAQAQAEAAQPKPDWIALVKQAQEANRLADDALAQAQGEFDAMDKLRDQVATARQLALGELQRLTQFAQLHAGDLSPDTGAALQRAQADAQQAEQAIAASDRAEEDARAAALRQAQDRFSKLADSAGVAYQQAYNEFQAVEQIRAQVSQHAQRATLAIQQAERSMQMYSNFIPRNSEGIQLIERAHALMSGIGTVRTQAEAQQAIANAQEAERNAQSADSLFRSYSNQGGYGTQGGYGGNRGGGVGDFVGGVVIGSMLGGGGGHHHHGHGGSGWGGSWGGGDSGGSSWGGGSSGGGDSGWGSGGGGGGDWGGGGGSDSGGGW